MIESKIKAFICRFMYVTIYIYYVCNYLYLIHIIIEIFIPEWLG